MTHKSHIYAPIDTHPLPDHDCKIDVKFECGSVLIGCEIFFGEYSEDWVIGFGHYPNSLTVDKSKIKSWRLSK